jgi:hypothetical protein
MKLSFAKKQVFILFAFSVFVSIAVIIHGLFFDLNFSEIKRLTFEGFILTLAVIFPALLFLEWIFDINNREEMKKIERQIKRKS